MSIVEVQRTRTGTKRKKKNGSTDEEIQEEEEPQKTRPYRFGQFDIIAVCMMPSTGQWDKFMYTVGNWLIPSVDDESIIQTLQPVAFEPNEDWTDDLLTCIGWLRAGKKKTIKGTRRGKKAKSGEPKAPKPPKIGKSGTRRQPLAAKVERPKLDL